MSKLKTYSVRLITKGLYVGEVEATSVAEAEERTFELWATTCPHPFEQIDDSELILVEVYENPELLIEAALEKGGAQ